MDRIPVGFLLTSGETVIIQESKDGLPRSKFYLQEVAKGIGLLADNFRYFTFNNIILYVPNNTFMIDCIKLYI